MKGQKLFDAVVERSELGAVAPFALARMMRRAGVVSPEEELTVEGLRKAFPHIEEVVRVYLKPQTAERAVERIRELIPGDANVSR